MGHVQVYEIAHARSMGEAYDKLHDAAEEEHGHEQGYSGAINSSMFRGDITRQYNAAKDKKKFIEEIQDKCSGECYGVCLVEPKSNPNKVKSKVTIHPQKGAKKWETVYIGFTLFDDRQVCEGKTQGECIKKARAYAEKHQCRVHITITKKLTKGEPSIGVVEYKPSNKEKLGKYLFIGDARE